MEQSVTIIHIILTPIPFRGSRNERTIVVLPHPWFRINQRQWYRYETNNNYIIPVSFIKTPEWNQQQQQRTLLTRSIVDREWIWNERMKERKHNQHRLISHDEWCTTWNLQKKIVYYNYRRRRRRRSEKNERKINNIQKKSRTCRFQRKEIIPGGNKRRSSIWFRSSRQWKK